MNIGKKELLISSIFIVLAFTLLYSGLKLGAINNIAHRESGTWYTCPDEWDNKKVDKCELRGKLTLDKTVDGADAEVHYENKDTGSKLTGYLKDISSDDTLLSNWFEIESGEQVYMPRIRFLKDGIISSPDYSHEYIIYFHEKTCNFHYTSDEYCDGDNLVRDYIDNDCEEGTTIVEEDSTECGYEPPTTTTSTTTTSTTTTSSTTTTTLQCYDDNDCSYDEECVNNKCQSLDCEDGYYAEDHECIEEEPTTTTTTLDDGEDEDEDEDDDSEIIGIVAGILIFMFVLGAGIAKMVK